MPWKQEIIAFLSLPRGKTTHLRQAGLGLNFRIAEKLSDSVENSKTRGFGSSANTSNLNGLSGDARSGVDVVRVELFVRRQNPRHFASSSSDVGSRNINTGSDKVLLAQLQRVPIEQSKNKQKSTFAAKS
jgi:hypothetical protein